MHRGAGRGNRLRGRPRRRGEYQGQRRAESHKEPQGSWRKRERGGALDLPKRKYNAEFGAATAVRMSFPPWLVEQVRRAQRRWSTSKSSETGSPFGGTTSTAAEPEAKSSTQKSNWRVAPVRVQPPSTEQMKLGWPEEEKGLSIWSLLETWTSKSFQKS